MFILVLMTSFFLFCCKETIFHEKYSLIMPKIPDSWDSLLGEPHWNIEWINSDGIKQRKSIEPGKNAAINLSQSWVSAIIAWPFWPDKETQPGYFMPAGALFPHDVSDVYGKTIIVRWVAGPDAVFFRELADAYGNSPGLSSSVTRLPSNFNWPRFRELFNSDAINEKVLADPWLVNWRSVAERTILTGFDRRRLVPETHINMPINVPAGIWYGNSPFAAPYIFVPGTTPVFPVTSSTGTWVSREGVLRCNQQAWVFIPW